MRVSLLRSRWAAIGAAVAVSLGAGGLGLAGAITTPANPVTTLISPCRLMDTRAASPVGPRNTPLGAGEAYTATVWGTNGGCTIPATATGVVLNVTIVGPTAPSFLTVWPADKTRPTASNLNWVAGQAPTPNQVSAALSVADGKMKLFNATGTVDVIVDISGYLTPADLSNLYTKAQVDAAVAAAAACKEYPHTSVNWHACDLHGATLANLTLGSANLSGGNFSAVTFTSSNLQAANLTGANLTGSLLTSASLGSAILTNANFTNANLTNAYLGSATGLSTANVSGVLWSNTTCPDLTNSNAHASTCVGH